MSINDGKFFYVHHCQTAKGMWDTLEMIYEVSQKCRARGYEQMRQRR